MKVSELIEKLRAMPQDLPIWVCDSSGNWMPIEVNIEGGTTIVPSEDEMGELIDTNAVIVTAGDME